MIYNNKLNKFEVTYPINPSMKSLKYLYEDEQ